MPGIRLCRGSWRERGWRVDCRRYREIVHGLGDQMHLFARFFYNEGERVKSHHAQRRAHQLRYTKTPTQNPNKAECRKSDSRSLISSMCKRGLSTYCKQSKRGAMHARGVSLIKYKKRSEQKLIMPQGGGQDAWGQVHGGTH